MTKVQNFFKNPFNAPFETVKQAGINESLTRTALTANELFKDKPFAKENKTTYLISVIIKYVANVVSFATAFFALRAVLALTVGSVVASGGALLLCALIELLKNSSWQTNVKAVLKYRKPSILGGLVLLLLSLLSIGASLYGAWLLPSEMTAPAVTTHTKNDSLILAEQANINTQIANLDALMIQTSAKAIPNEKGQISGTIKTLMKTQTTQKDSLNAQKRAIQQQINLVGQNYQAREKEAKEAHESSILTAKISCVVVAILFELIYTICCVYGFYYLFRVYIDTKAGIPQTDQPNDLQTVIPNDQTEPHQHTPTNQTTKRKIGFFSDQPNDQTADKYTTTNPNLTDNQTDQTNQPNGFTTVLKPFADGLVSEENGIKFVYHNGKKYTKADVQNNVWAFRSKVKNYEQTDLTKAAKYKQHLVRWETYLISIS